jgi:3-oxoacyl-[acyl-carrier-protein] synthase III
MTKLKRAAITSVGHFVPPDVYDNHYFESFLETTDEWIRERTGIIERRFLKEGATSDLAVPAIQKCLERRGIGADEIDLIVVATVTPDMFFPSTACVIQDKIGAKNAWGFDISAACSAFLFALNVASKYIESGMHSKVLVVGADKMSAIMNFNDRNTAILFGDGCGVALLEPIEDDSLGLLDFELHTDGSGGRYLYMAAGGSSNPATNETVANQMHYISQDGKAVFKVAVVGMADVSESIMRRNNLSAEDVRWLVPHQANLRIISATAERMGLSMDRVMVNINRYGNTTAGTIPICLSEWWEQGLIDKGDGIVLATFGAGYTWGAGYLRWAY